MSAETPSPTGSKTWIMLRNGQPFEYADITSNKIDITVIAHALAGLNRFANQTDHPYSVGQHSVMVSRICAPQDALWGLLHDASEAYLVDMPTPLKHFFPLYKMMERVLQGHIMQSFGLHVAEPVSVKLADTVMLATEGRDLFRNGWPYETLDVKPLTERIEPWTYDYTKRAFLKRAKELIGARV